MSVVAEKLPVKGHVTGALQCHGVCYLTTKDGLILPTGYTFMFSVDTGDPVFLLRNIQQLVYFA